MGTKRQELIDGCFAKVTDDEPFFILRGKDKLAPALVRKWARQFAVSNYMGYGMNIEKMDKYLEAL